jgi:hypothetical protein
MVRMLVEMSAARTHLLKYRSQKVLRIRRSKHMGHAVRVGMSSRARQNRLGGDWDIASLVITRIHVFRTRF